MKETFISKSAEQISAVLAVAIMLILSLWGAAAMLVGSVILLAVYVLIFKDRLRGRGWLAAVVACAVAAAVAAAVAMAVSLN